MPDLPQANGYAAETANVPPPGRRSETLTGTIEVEFPEFLTPPPEPMGLLASWLDSSVAHGVREPRALALATADACGRSSSRIVALGSVTKDGLVFLSHSASQKGRELAENPWASGVLYWRETSQQITLAGPVEKLPDAESDRLWSARPVFTHAMSTASRQSRTMNGLDEVDELRATARRLADPPRPLPRPATFTAYRLVPETVEFWADGTDRLHERLRYDRTDGGWDISRLQP
ncbi:MULTISPECIES: phenazine biosynthesis FMN-dependent oxidase PhzG [unclassified Streptomyces]|uniref:phenazine biosynthesis FMN-dependent oxidase PhzG n=1 Tax=unclassified Streptomyces TaxID=2593676 RepID=UPI0033D84AAD